MKKMVAFAVVLLAGVAAAVRAQETPKLTVAVIDVQQVVNESAAGKETMGRLRKLQDDKLAEGRKMSDDLEALKKQLATQRATLTDAKVAEIEKQIEDKQVELQRFSDDTKQQLQDAQRKELDALEKQIMPIIDELGREMKLQLIFNKFQSGLVYADDAVDITEQVVRRFNSKVTAAPAPAGK
jgi:outer membrane protein